MASLVLPHLAPLLLFSTSPGPPSPACVTPLPLATHSGPWPTGPCLSQWAEVALLTEGSPAIPSSRVLPAWGKGRVLLSPAGLQGRKGATWSVALPPVSSFANTTPLGWGSPVG